MGGWNIFYGLLNFAILAAALYFIGWKLVVKMFKSRRDRIADELEQAKQAKEKAENIRVGLDKARAEGDAQGEAIIAKAKETAERSSEEARRADEKSAADIAAGARSDAEQIDYELRRKLTNAAAGECKTQRAVRQRIFAPRRADREVCRGTEGRDTGHAGGQGSSLRDGRSERRAVVGAASGADHCRRDTRYHRAGF